MKDKKEEPGKLKEVKMKASDLQKLYSERIERFMALVEISYALKTAHRITQNK